MAPETIFRRSLAGPIPALDKVVVHISDRWARHFNVDIVALTLAEVAR